MSIDSKMDRTNEITEKEERKAQLKIKAIYQDGLDRLRATLDEIDRKYGNSDGVVTFAEMNKYDRMVKLNKEQREIMNDVASKARAATISFGATVWLTNYYGTGFALETELQEKLGYTVIKKSDVRVVNPDMELSFTNNKTFEQTKVRNIVQRGLSQGKPIREISKDLREQMGKSADNANTTARTAMTRLQNEAIQESGEKAARKGIDLVKKWNSTLDKETRREHRKLDQKKVELDEEFEVNGFRTLRPGGFGVPGQDYNCRCRLTYVPRDATEPEYRRARGTDGRNKVIPYTNYDKWYKNRVKESN